jgi:beta-glucosidase
VPILTFQPIPVKYYFSQIKQNFLGDYHMIARKNHILVTALILFIPQSILSSDWEQEIHWDWTTAERLSDKRFWDSLIFPKKSDDFLWGIATSAFQIEGTQSTHGHCSNNWTLRPHLNQPGTAVDHWDRYQEDVQLIKNLGMNSYRFSIEWSKIEPKKGVFDRDAMQHYIDLCNELINNNIKPIPCLFHHTWPDWFDEKGAFEKKENIQDFVDFACYVFQALPKNISMWMTLNEPVAYAIEGYFRGKYPPCKKSLKLTGIVVNNMLNAHVAIYQAFKKINPELSIGFTKVFNPLDPYHSWNPLEKYVCIFFNYLLHDVALNFFKTGHFNWANLVTDYNPDAPQSLDYLGVNYYTHAIIKYEFPFGLCHTSRPEELLDGSSRALYAEGLYRSIQKASTLRIPLYIAENGINDPEDTLKNNYLKRHLFVIKFALEKGYDIRGYFWWTLMDSFSWNRNMGSKMGLYAIDQETKERTLREGAKPFRTFLLEKSGKEKHLNQKN